MPFYAPPKRVRFGRGVPFAGMADWGAAAVGLIADKELGALMKGVRGLIDKLISLIGARGAILDGYKVAHARYTSAQAKFGPLLIAGPMGMTQNVLLLPFASAYATAQKGVKVLAREVQTIGFLDRIFTQISAALTQAGLSSDANAIDQAVAQIRRFAIETDDLFFPIPEYMQTKRSILTEGVPIWRSLGVGATAYDDPKWMAGYLKAANAVVPVEGAPAAPADLQAAGMGALPIIAQMILYVIVIVSVGMSLASAISRVIPNQNAKAETAEKLLLEAQKQKAKEASQMRAAGASEAQIDARMAAIDTEVARAVSTVPDAPSLFKPMIAVAGVVAAGYVAGKATGVL